VRLYTFIGLAVLRCWRLTGMRPLPAFFASKLADTQRMFAEDLVPSYQLLKDKAGNLTCLKFSAYHDALVQSL
jgi:hypothetical protein